MYVYVNIYKYIWLVNDILTKNKTINNANKFIKQTNKKKRDLRSKSLLETVARQNYNLKGFSSTKYIISIFPKVNYTGLSHLVFDAFET